MCCASLATTLPVQRPAFRLDPLSAPRSEANSPTNACTLAFAGELPASSTMVPVLARLLEFSPAELRRLQEKAATQASSSAGAAALFAGMPSFKLPGLPGLPGSK